MPEFLHALKPGQKQSGLWLFLGLTSFIRNVGGVCSTPHDPVQDQMYR